MKMTSGVALTALIVSSLAHAASERNPTTKIIGGVEADPNAWPFITALIRKDADNFNGQFCGASYLGDGFVLTAAHCLVNQSKETFDVLIGESDLNSTATQRIGIKNIYVHEQYDDSSTENDIAILQLVSEPTGKTSVALADNTLLSGLNAGTLFTVIGWGNQDPNGGSEFGPKLRQVDVGYVTLETCKATGGNYASITENALCAGFAAGGKDSCQGDSGGPLLFNDSGTIKQIGVVSWGDGCAQPNKYGVYASVPFFTNWIASKTFNFSFPQGEKVGIVGVGDNTHKFTFKNDSQTAVTLSNATATTKSISANTCNTTLQTGESCSVDVAFSVAQAGDVTVAVSLDTDNTTLGKINASVVYKGLANAAQNVATAVNLGSGKVVASAKPWTLDNATFVSGNINDGESTTLGMLEVGKGNLTLKGSVSSEANYDKFIVKVNNVEVKSFSGSTSFDETINLTEASNSIELTYSKDDMLSDGQDQVRITEFKLDVGTGNGGGNGGGTTPPASSSSSSSASSMGWLSLMFVLLGGWLRRRHFL